MTFKKKIFCTVIFRNFMFRNFHSFENWKNKNLNERELRKKLKTESEVQSN